MRTIAIYAIIIKKNQDIYSNKKGFKDEVQIIVFWRNFNQPEKARTTYRRYSYAVSPAIKKLVEHQPWTNLTKYMAPHPTKSPLTTRNIGGIDWNPIITPNLKLLAELDILIMHPEIVGMARSDIDNRIKTLFDGLRCPQNEHEIGANTPRDIGPIYTLLDDDHLITKLTVNTSHMLDTSIFNPEITRTPDTLFMLIDVNVRVAEGNLENLPFMV